MYQSILSFLLLILIRGVLFSQEECEMPEQRNVEIFNRVESSCETLENTPLKYVRIAFDVFQKSDGSGNFTGGETLVEKQIILLVDRINQKMANLTPHIPVSECPHIQDSKIRFVISYIHFYNDDGVYNYAFDRYKGATYPQDVTICDSIYSNVILTNSNLDSIDLNNSLHVMLLPTAPEWFAGRASGFADKKWIMARGYNSSRNWNYEFNESAESHLIHEIGHSMGNYHSWSGCERFSQATSNNYMDYPLGDWSDLVSFTNCQLVNTHSCLDGLKGNISDCVLENYYVQNETINNIKIVESDNVFAGENVTSEKPQGIVNVKNGSSLIFIPKNEVYLRGGFEVENGGEFEIR